MKLANNYKRHLTAAQEYERPAETIETLILRVREINTQIKTTDPFRFNKDALLYSIKQLLPDDMNLLLHTNNDMLEQFLGLLSEAARRLSSQQTKKLIILLQPLYEKHAWLQLRLNELLQQQQKQERWEKNKIVLAVVVALILCIIIFFAARN